MRKIISISSNVKEFQVVISISKMSVYLNLQHNLESTATFPAC